MYVQVVCLRIQGKALPRWQLSCVEAKRGYLSIEECYSDYLSRFMRSARLLNSTNNHADVFPPLRDAAVLWVKGNIMTITGFEHIELIDYAQTWLVELVECAPSVYSNQGSNWANK
jgi:hypothetical protein